MDRASNHHTLVYTHTNCDGRRMPLSGLNVALGLLFLTFNHRTSFADHTANLLNSTVTSTCQDRVLQQ